MIYTDQIKRISNSFYNDGLAKARRRDLTGAAEQLKTCLNLNHFHIQARNLLGLIYFEMGEISEALYQWVISTNLKSDNNRAALYIRQVQAHEEELGQIGADIRKFNEALSQAQFGNPDLAAVQLGGVAERQPRFVKAKLVLALIMMRQENYARAESLLSDVLAIDRGNPKAGRYMLYVREHLAREEKNTRKRKGARKNTPVERLSSDDVIIPPTYKENTGWQSILNIGAGLLLGCAAIYFLVMPTRIKQENINHTQELLSYNEQLNQKNEEIESLNRTLETYKADKEAAEQQLDTMINDSGSIYSQYQTLVRVLNAMRSGDITGAAMLYPEFHTDLLTDETVRQIADSVKQEIGTSSYQSLEDRAYETWNAGHFQDALDLYRVCLAIRPDNPKVLLYSGTINRSLGNNDEAIRLFTEVVVNFPDSQQASGARTQLAELSPEAAQQAANAADAKRHSDEAAGNEAAAEGAGEGGESGGESGEAGDNGGAGADG